ncbi:ribonuclease P protein component [Algisphaera agarilytica]|uniref:ribonuclease P protein component n=1 Tax=Algisphaera agarilytica TaxID=1385975 RepID=UPI0028F3E57E|nr:ribonuclease P protein component [Algisphaera agarilytica]
MRNPKSEIRNRFTHAHRLHGRRAFSAVFDAKVRKNAGPLLLFTMPNDLPHWRLGLSVSRRVGNAVTRSRHKRMLREAFRLTQNTWPKRAGADPEQPACGYDLVVVVRPHELMSLEDYQRQLFSGVAAAHRTWEKRLRNADDTQGPD